jgi:hypothetical protein
MDSLSSGAGDLVRISSLGRQGKFFAAAAAPEGISTSAEPLNGEKITLGSPIEPAIGTLWITSQQELKIRKAINCHIHATKFRLYLRLANLYLSELAFQPRHFLLGLLYDACRNFSQLRFPRHGQQSPRLLGDS